MNRIRQPMSHANTHRVDFLRGGFGVSRKPVVKNKGTVVSAFVLVVRVFLISGLLSGAAGGADTSEIPSLISALQSDPALQFCGAPVPLSDPEVRERFEKEMLLTLWDRSQVILWLKRSRRYLPYIERTLKKNGLPDDLKYVAVVESALRPHAGSRRGAIGFWQFMTTTGRKYGLVINRYRDERRNIFASTEAAVRYFRDLYEEFGSWELAAAAYNMGEEGLTAEILEQDTRNYYNLYLPLETQRFIFRILSVKLILTDPGRYGFNLAEADYYPPLAYDRVEVTCRTETPIRVIAQSAKTHFKTIKDLNPELRGHYLSEGTHTLLVPQGAGEGFQSRFEELVAKHLAARAERVYIVQKGDNLSVIAERFDVPLAALIIWNRIDLKRPIHPGQRLVIFRGETQKSEPEAGEESEPSG